MGLPGVRTSNCGLALSFASCEWTSTLRTAKLYDVWSIFGG